MSSSPARGGGLMRQGSIGAPRYGGVPRSAAQSAAASPMGLTRSRTFRWVAVEQQPFNGVLHHLT